MNKVATGWFELYVADMQRARKFYEAVFNTSLEKLEVPGDLEMWQFPGDMESYGANGALVRMENMQPGPGGTLIYFSSEDASIEESRVEENGGKIINSKMSIGEYGFVAIFEDTEGNVVGLHSMK